MSDIDEPPTVVEEDGVDHDARLRAVELSAQSNRDALVGHERECAVRYQAILKGQDDIKTILKYLAFAVVALALVVVGIASVKDILRGGLHPMGIELQQH
jgi:hypothetical protein